MTRSCFDSARFECEFELTLLLTRKKALCWPKKIAYFSNNLILKKCKDTKIFFYLIYYILLIFAYGF